MSSPLSGKVALITGAGSGIGRAAALALAHAGAAVLASDRAAGDGAQTVKLVEAAGGRAQFIRCDVTDSQQVQRLVHETVGRFGRLDIAFNNAGIQGELNPTADTSEKNFDRTLAVNLKGVWLCLKHELPVMAGQGGGVVINTASVLGLRGAAGLCAYVASKHGIIGLTKTAALEYAGKNIRVCAVCPGLIDTPMTQKVARLQADAKDRMTAAAPLGRLGTPEEVASAVVFLASDAAAFVTGHALVIDGGMTVQ